MSRAAQKDIEVQRTLKKENESLKREIRRLRKELLKLGAGQEAEPQEQAAPTTKSKDPACPHCGPNHGTKTFVTPSGKKVIACLNCHERIVV